MPFLYFMGLENDTLNQAKEELVKCLSKDFDTPNDYIVITNINVTNIYNVYPFVEIKMFERSEEIKNNVADTISRILKKYNIFEIEIAFMYYKKDNYIIK